MMAANYRHIGGGENRLGRHYSRFAGIWPTSFLADQSLTLRKSQNAGSNRPSRASKGGTVRLGKLRSGASLIVAEGIESAPAVAELSGWPAWAALSAGGVERLILPPV